MAHRRDLAISAPSRFGIGLLRPILIGILILGLVSLVVLGAAGGFFTFRIITEHNEIENVSPQNFLLSNYESLSFTDLSGGEHDGWLLRGLKGAPAIILCPGYDSNRSDQLSLGAVLQENHFNVYIFNFRGPKTRHTNSDLGVRQAGDVQAAITWIAKQPGINPHRVGLFGPTSGGYAALVAAEGNPLVKAIAVDSIYEKPVQMFNAQLDQLLGGPSTFFRFLAEKEFSLVNLGTKIPPVRENLSKLANIPKLFILGRDTPSLASITEDLYNAAPQPKTLREFEHSQSAQASGAERKEYENQILSFFLRSLPLRAD